MKKLLRSLIVFLLFVSLAACSAAKKIAGTYELTSMSSDSTGDMTEAIETIKALGLSITLELKEDGTGALKMLEQEEPFTYDASKKTMKFSDAEEEIPFKYENKTISFEEDGASMTFTLVEEDSD